MNALQVFTYTDHPVGVIEINGDPFFVGKDVAGVLKHWCLTVVRVDGAPHRTCV